MMATDRSTRLVALVLGISACREPAPTAAPTSAAAEPDAIGLDGHGGLRFGMTLAQAEAALGEPLGAAAQGCALVAPPGAGTPPALRWMVVDGVLVRVDIETDGVLADGGGRVGMSADELRRRYPDAVDSGPQKYDPQGRTWSVGPADAVHFVFEIDASGRVASWRVGRVPEVDWVERCG